MHVMALSSPLSLNQHTHTCTQEVKTGCGKLLNTQPTYTNLQ